MIGLCFTCGKPLGVSYEAICAESCREEYYADIRILVERPVDPQTRVEAVDKLIEASKLPVVEPPREPPTIKQMSGLIPNFTGGRSMKEYMEELSDES